jgi:hypothetical protein
MTDNNGPALVHAMEKQISGISVQGRNLERMAENGHATDAEFRNGVFPLL